MRKILLTLLSLLAINAGVWAANQTYTVTNPTTDVHKSGPITIQGESKTSQKIDNSNQTVYVTNNGSLIVFSTAANITSISFDACSSSSGSGTEALATIKAQSGATFTTPTSNYTATTDGSSLASLTNIQITKNQSSHTRIVVNFTTPVSAVEIAKGSASNTCRIKNVNVTYDNAIIAPSSYSEGHFTSTTAGTATNSCSWGSFTLNETTVTVSDKDYYKRNSGTAISYNLASGEKLAAGDVILLDLTGATASKTISMSLTNGPTWTQKTATQTSHNFIYVIPAGSALINATSFSFTINNTDTYVYGVQVFHTPSASCSTPAAPTAVTAGSTTSTGTTLTITDAANAASYDIYYSTSSSEPDGETEATTTSTSKTKALTGLTASTTYYVWVRSVCDESNKSDWVALTGSTFTTLCTSHTVTAATNNPSYGTAAAASTTVCEGSTTTVTATPKSGYSFVSWAVSGTGSSLSSTSTNPTTLTMGTANATVTATFGCATPSAPSALVASSTTSSGTTLTITDAANTNNYEIYYSTSSTAPEAGTSATATSTSKTKALTGLSASTTYYVWVRSVCDSTHKSSWTALTGSTFTTDAACTDPGLTITLN